MSILVESDTKVTIYSAMKYLGITLMVFLLIAMAGALYLKYRMNNTPDKKDLEASLDAVLEQLLDNGLYGVVIGVYKDKKSFIKGYGSVTKGGGVAPSATTVFEIASITKLFTASTLQLLCDKGILRLDSTLAEMLGHNALSQAAENVTLRELATHHSGFPTFPKQYLRKVPDFANISRDITVKDMYAYLEHPEDKAKSGHFGYSNFGAGLLGHLLEISTGKSYENIVSETLLAPLGMTHTFVTLNGGRSTDMAQGYSMRGDQVALLDWFGGSLNGAGALKSTASDMLLFIKANVDDNPAPISLSIKKTHEPQFDGKTGLGWILPDFIDRFVGNQTIRWHNGLTPGYASYIAIDPKNKTGLIILSNKAADVTFLGTMLMRQVRTQSWAL